MSKIVLPVFDNDVDYFDMVLKYERDQDKNFNDDVMFQINERLGKDKKHTGVCAGQLFVVEEKGQNLDDDGRNQFWYKWVCGILRKTHRRKKMDIKQMNMQVEKLNSLMPDEKIWAFITIGFDDEKIACGNYEQHIKKVAQICYTVSHLVYEKGAIQNVEYVIEKHRVTGIHHHAHFLFTFNSKVPPSTMINKIFAARGVAEYVRQKNFIDYIGPQKPNKEKPCAPFETYRRYITGDKREEKLSFVGLDRGWRDNNKLQQIYCV